MEPRAFRRLVLGLQPRAPDVTMQLAVELAELLQLDLLGLFLADTSLHHLAGIPFAREIRPLGGSWHPIDVERMSHDIELAARTIERLFAAAAKRLPRPAQFEVARGSLMEALQSFSRAGDIVMIAEPVSPGERASRQFEWLTQAAFRSAAAVLLVPPRISRTNGPVAAIATDANDPSIRAGAAIAAAAKAPLIVVDAGGTCIEDAVIKALCADLPVSVSHVVVGDRLRAHPAMLSTQIHPFHERLMVVTRGVLDDAAASALASIRGIPVLIVEPEAAAFAA